MLRKRRKLHLHANLNIDILSLNGDITRPNINLELMFLLCLKGIMIRNSCGKFQSNICSSWLDNLEKFQLHANLNLGILSPKGDIIRA